jgi:hypothetical protein
MDDKGDKGDKGWRSCSCDKGFHGDTPSVLKPRTFLFRTFAVCRDLLQACSLTPIREPWTPVI